MKSIEKYLIYFLLLAVAGLYIMHFSSNDTEDVQVEASDTLVAEPKGEKTGRIYYINTDTVWGKYDFVQEITAKLESKKNQYEGQVQSQVRNFEREVNEFREKGPMMTEMEVQIKQRELVNKESELSRLSEELEMKFLREEKEWNDKLRKRIIDFIDQKTQDKSYDYILGYSITSNIILANDSLDLTDEIVQGLNEDYTAEKNNAAK